MKVNKEEVPFIDLSPKLKRPLSLWNPLDYLRLLFWVFFFPQAIWWYVDTFGNNINLNRESKKIRELIKVLHDEPIQQKLILQAFVTMLLATLGIFLILREFNVPINWFGALFGVSISVLIIVLTVKFMGFQYTAPVVRFVMVSILVVVASEVFFGLFFCIIFGEEEGWLFDFLLHERNTLKVGSLNVPLKFFVASSIIIIVIGMHLLEYVMTTFYLTFFSPAKKIKCLPHLARNVYLPLPGIQKNLESQLEADWEKGVQNANQLLTFSHQFISVVRAIKAKLEQSPGDIMLARVSALTTNLYDWELFPGLTGNPFHLFWKKNFKPRLDTPAHAACAGFWYWHKKEPGRVEEAFAIERDLRHGLELYNTAQAIDRGIAIKDIQNLSSWEQETEWLGSLPVSGLRPGTLKALCILHAIAGEARVALNARSPLNRSTAVNRAAVDLTILIETGGNFCPEPEWPLIRDLAENWKDIFTRAGGVIGKAILRQPILNPYEGYSGLPVTDTTFRGRADILRQIETHWVSGELMPAIILYGHRRMGKTSILRSLAKNTDANNLYVYLDLQRSSMIEHTGHLLRDFAAALHKVVVKSCPGLGSFPERADFSGLDAGRRTLDTLLDRIDTHLTESQRLILAIDEFELIENGIHDGKLDQGLLLYLRSINQEYRWLGLIFAGLHTLEEMGHDYQSAFYGQAQYIRVSYLTRDDALKLITQPHPDFSLEYEDVLIDEIYRLTFGQPYLVQLLCWELVTRWNERFLEKGDAIPRVLKLEGLEPVLTPAFYQAAGYYFDGVWGNATKNEQTLLRILARYPNPLPQKELEAAAINAGFPPDPEIMKKTLKLLSQHDIITESETGIGFAAELMRHWVQQQN